MFEKCDGSKNLKQQNTIYGTGKDKNLKKKSQENVHLLLQNRTYQLNIHGTRRLKRALMECFGDTPNQKPSERLGD